MSTTPKTCPSCTSAVRLSTADVTAATPIVAEEIARGGDLGGILDLANAVAMARVEAGAVNATPTMASLQAAATVVIKLVRVVEEFRRLGVFVPSGSRCPACELRHRLDPLIARAAIAAARRELAIAEGMEVSDSDQLVDAVKDLAAYAGDGFPDSKATRAVLDLAADVFVLAARR